MADTQRTATGLRTLYGDAVSGGITPQTSRDFVVSTYNILDLQADDNIYIFENHAALLIDWRHGTAAGPIAAAGPSVKISRTEMISSIVQPNAANSESNAALSVISKGIGATTAQVTAGFFGSRSAVGSQDVLGLAVIGMSESGNTGGGLGGYFEGRTYSSGKAFAAEFRVSNLTGASVLYSPGGPLVSGIWITANDDSHSFGDVLHSSGAAIGIGGVNNTPGGGISQFDVGIGLTTGSVKTATLRDDTSSTTSLDIRGTHTTILDTSNATVSGLIINALSASDVQATFKGSGTHNGAINLDTVNTGHQAAVNFVSAGTAKWAIIKQTDDSLLLYDSAAALVQGKFVTGAPGANATAMYLNEGAGAGTLRRVNWKAGNALGSGDKVMVLV